MITNKLELELVKLQERNYDLKHTIFNAIELLKKGNSDKAIKILKKVLYEWSWKIKKNIWNTR